MAQVAITEASSSRTKILAALAAPERNSEQVKAKLIALLDLFPDPDPESFVILPPNRDEVVHTWTAAKAVLEDAKLEVDRAKVEILSEVQNRRFLITSDRSSAVDTRRQAPNGTVSIEGPSIPEARRLGKLAEATFSAEGLTAQEFEAILKVVPRERCRVGIGGFGSIADAEDLLTSYPTRATYRQSEPCRIAKACKVPAFVAK